MFVTVILSALALLSLGLLLWQFVVTLRFPLHARTSEPAFTPGITLLKPLKGFDEHTAKCLRSWFSQKYPAPVQLLFGVAEENDPVCNVVRALLKEFPQSDAKLIITGKPHSTNAKVSTLAHLSRHAKHQLICVSDADVRVPEDFLTHAVPLLNDPSVGLVNCFYRLANPSTLAMHVEAISVNADFWSQVLQSNTLKPQDFALGAVMVTRRDLLDKIGGFESLLDFLADDYHLGNRIARTGARIELSPVVVECWDRPMKFSAVWSRQLRWAKTVRVCKPGPYFLSILNNTTLWTTLLALFGNLGGFPLIRESLLHGFSLTARIQGAVGSLQVPWVLVVFVSALVVRVSIVAKLQQRIACKPSAACWWMVVTRDIMSVAVWAAAFIGNAVEWRGRKFRLTRGGRLVPS